METNDIKLNLGSGRKSYKGFINVDKVALKGVDILYDLEKKPLPFKTDSVSEIICEHIFEHIINYIPFLEELYRISKHRAKIYVIVPYFRSEAAYRDPTHVRFFTERSFDFFQESVELCYYSNIRFDIKKVELRAVFRNNFKSLYKNIYKLIPFKKCLSIFLWNIFTEIYFELEVLK